MSTGATPIGVGMLGCGVVGAGVVKLLQDKSALYAHRTGRRIELAKVGVRDPHKDRGVALDAALLTTDLHAVTTDPDVDIVVELMGGTEPAVELMLEAIRHGKHVVTANKEAIAKFGREIFTAANEMGVDVYFEASVGGGIPVIQPFKRSLIANEVTELAGIINGTTNYILTAMTEQARDLADVLDEAQRLGYAEADPTADVDGHDAKYKLAILASLIFGCRIDVDQIHCEGIRGVTATDIAYAKQFGYVIKLLAKAAQHERGIEARVHPCLVPVGHPMAAVNGVYNALFLKGDAVGDVMLYGRGAGQMPTASAVVSDILNIASDITAAKSSRLMACQHNHTGTLLPMSETISQFYLRLSTHDRPGVLGFVGSGLGQHGISIETFVQSRVTGGLAEMVFITRPAREADIQHALTQLKASDSVHDVSSVLRVGP
ncbi:MAG: homoserine dehydrogenase [Candidatus Sericytochromatia bacterium]|nr:homoserine dehydrogenase [Candidatus Sericytochromatia bacterium]